MVKIQTNRTFSHSNGFSDAQYIITIESLDKKITKFDLAFTKTPTPALLHLLAQELHEIATVIEDTLNGK